MTERTSPQPWRDIDIFWIALFYVLILFAFLLLEAALFGTEVLKNSPRHPVLFLVEEIIDACILIFLPIFVVLKVYRAHLNEIGLTERRFILNIVLGMIVGLVLFGFVFLYEHVIHSMFGAQTHHPYLDLLNQTSSLYERAVIYVSLLVLFPLAEEVFFRGFAYTVLRRNHGRTIALVGSATLFAAVHFNAVSFVPVWVTGVTLAILLDRTASLLPSITAHVSFNILAVTI